MKSNYGENSALEYYVASEPSEDLSESIRLFPHDRILRTLGLLLQQAGITEYDLRVSDALYSIYTQVVTEDRARPSLMRQIFGFGGAQKRRPQLAMRQLEYSIADLLNFEAEGRRHRKQASHMPDPFSTSQILRGVGRFLDKRAGSRLLGVTVKERSVGIDFLTAGGRKQRAIQDFEYFYNYWVKMYLQRSDRCKITLPREPPLYVAWESLGRHHVSASDKFMR